MKRGETKIDRTIFKVSILSSVNNYLRMPEPLWMAEMCFEVSYKPCGAFLFMKRNLKNIKDKI